MGTKNTWETSPQLSLEMEPIIMKQQKQTKKQSLKKILFGSVVFVGLSAGSVQHSYAQSAAIAVSDQKQHSETWLEWLKQQMQYILQI